MIHGDSKGNSIDIKLIDGDIGRQMSCIDTWVWPPLLPRVTNSTLLVNNMEACSCISHIRNEQHQYNISKFNSNYQPISFLHENNLKPLSFLFNKELTQSDIKKRNKIILHKRDVEIHFPRVKSRQGVRLYMEDKKTKETYCFIFRCRITNDSKVYSLEGTRNFLQVHDLKVGDYVVIHKDDQRRKYVIGASKETKEVSKGESSVTIVASLVSNSGATAGSSSYVYFNKLSDFSIVDEMEEAATPQTPYTYGNVSWNGSMISCNLERLAPLQTFKSF